MGDGAAYATKAFLCKAMARAPPIRKECSSTSRRAVNCTFALSAGVTPKRIVLHGNNKDETELETALRIGVGRVGVDSFDELDRIDALLRHASGNSSIGLLVRVTPGVEAHTHEFVDGPGSQSSGLGSGADRCVALPCLLLHQIGDRRADDGRSLL